MKNILAFGDSITWGSVAGVGTRHPFEDRWPNVLEQHLDGQARVFAEGLGGRTTVFDDFTANTDRNGGRILPTLLGTHAPLELVIIMLGTNDLKPAIHGSARTASFGIKRLCQIVRGHFAMTGAAVPQILVVSPPETCLPDVIDAHELASAEAGVAQSKLFAHYYALAAKEYDVAFFDAAKVAKASPVDGVHLDAENTRAIGVGLAPIVKQLLSL